MASSLSRTSFADLLKGLIQMEQWLHSIRITTQGTRFDQVVQIVKETVDHYNQGKITELERKIEAHKVWTALVDSHSFIDIYESFRSLKSHQLHLRKLRSAIEGPFYSKDECPSKNNIEPRNTIFELEVAAKLIENGLEVIGFDDIDFIFQDTIFNVQCKRIHSKRKIKDNIDKAASQFTVRMTPGGNTKGIICLSIDKLMGIEDKPIEVNKESEIGIILNQRIDSFRKAHRDKWLNLLNTNILAVMIFIHAVVEIKSLSLNTACCQVAISGIPDETIPQLRDSILIREFASQLMPTANHIN